MAGEAVANPTTTSVRPRPQLKGHHAAFMKRHLIIGCALAVGGVILTKLLVNDPRKRAYAEYYKNYDIEAHFHRIRKAGHFQSIGPDDEMTVHKIK